jgi:hypothetical protein
VRRKAFGILGAVAVTAAAFAFPAACQPAPAQATPPDPHAPFAPFKIGDGLY